ncbi:hypothetical protein ACOMHN_058905 [Nucella lapillus]
MIYIPKTKAEFDKMGFLSQMNVKDKLCQDKFSLICSAVNPQTLPRFAPVLDKGDLEELHLSIDRLSRQRVSSNLLLKITSSCRKDITWWGILEKVLLDGDAWDAYNALNPWEPWEPEGDEEHGRRGGEERRGRGASLDTLVQPDSSPHLCEDGGGIEEVKAESHEAAPRSKPHNLSNPRADTQQSVPNQSVPNQPVPSQSVPSQSLAQEKPVVNIYCDRVNTLTVNLENTADNTYVRMGGGDETEPDPSMTATQEPDDTGDTRTPEDTHVSAISEESLEGANYGENPPSYQPDPTDLSAQYTHPKQIYSGCDEEETILLTDPEGEEDVSDIDLPVADVQFRSANRGTDSLPESTFPTEEETDETGNKRSADDAPTYPRSPASQQPPSPSPPHHEQHGGVMTILSRAWVSVRDALFGIE